jgi:4-hydroxyphenylpyruvate dioxygenase
MEIDRIHFYVTDATQTRDWLIEKMGLQSLDDACGDLARVRVDRDTLTYLVGNPYLLFSISSPLNSDSPVADYLELHPAGVKDIAFRVRDLDAIAQNIDRMGVKVLANSDPQIDLPWVRIQGWGAIEHTIIQTPAAELNGEAIDPDRTITGIDHLVLNVASGDLEPAVKWYQNLFNFQVQQIFNIQTKRSGLVSQALISPDTQIKFNINEPSSTNSQIQEFLNANRGAGIQHIALYTNNIFQTVDRLQQRGLAFLPVPKTYYTQLQMRAIQGQISPLTRDEWQTLERLQILLDWDWNAPEALLMQIFTQPIFDRKTFFFEAIERRNRARGFGQGNFQALFEAIELYNQK